MNRKYTWIPFYMELADRLKDFRSKRSELIDIIKSIYHDLGVKMPTLENGPLSDIDPFTVFGLFNKSITDSNRLSIINGFAEKLSIQSELPDDFNGIPVMNPLQAAFYGFGDDRAPDDIDNLWRFFITAIDYADNKTEKNKFCQEFNIVIKQYCVRLASLTMGLFWIRPYKYLNFDGINQKFLRNKSCVPSEVVDLINNIMIKKKNYDPYPKGEVYLEICETCIKALQESDFEYKDFPSLSFFAWNNSKKQDDKMSTEWFPSHEEYDPELSVDDWLELFKDKSVFTDDSFTILYRILEIGGAATCKELSEKYGQDRNYYNKGSSTLAQRVHKKTNCPLMSREEENARWWPVLYVGRHQDSGKTGGYVWKLREELKEALEIYNPDTNIRCWFVGAYSDSDDTHQDEEFVQKGIWQNGYTDKFLDTVNKVKVGDKIAIKTSYTRKKELPFDNHGETISVMKIKTVGTVTANHMDGRTLDVDWDESFKPKEWYFYTFRNTISLPKEDDWRTKALLDFVFKNIPQDYSKFQKEPEPAEYLNPYSSKLIESKNIIFRGAPGTGKTFLAKQIAADIISNGCCESYDRLSDEQKKQIAFVQFHPSFDYSDFVEGLRPVIKDDHSMVFRLQDGIFKSFVNIARDNYEHSKKPKEVIEKETSIEKSIETFFNEIEFGVTKFKTITGSEFTITNVDDEHIYVYISGNYIVKDLCLNTDEIRKMLESDQKFEKIKDITNFFGKKYATRDFSYDFAIFKEIIAKKKTISKTVAPQVELKKYVFIIDEINRGEISKIFGELFFAIDPGYRGRPGEVLTQYAHLHPDEKFYIPENVYIIGTMNDIDRSVDSFDFAMRRRFRFIEIKADDSIKMLSTLENNDLIAEAKRRMISLNKSIIENKEAELNENYQIGAAYFLKLKTMSFEQLWTDCLRPLLQEYIHGAYNESDIMADFESAYNNPKLDSGDIDEFTSDQ